MTLKMNGAYRAVLDSLWQLLPEDITLMLFVLPHVVRQMVGLGHGATVLAEVNAVTEAAAAGSIEL